MKELITIEECSCFDGINAMLRQLYFDMAIDQTEGTVLQLCKADGIHAIKMSDCHGHVGYAYAIKVDGAMEVHALFPFECRGSWGIAAADKVLHYLSDKYCVKKFVSGRYSCHKAAGIFLNRLGFIRKNKFKTGNTKDGVPLSYSTYKLEMK